MQRHTLESQNSYERIRQLVKKEGKTARNLVTWSVPAVDSTTTTTTSSCSSADIPTTPSSSQRPKKDDDITIKAGERSQGRVGGRGRGRERKSSSPKPGIVRHQLIEDSKVGGIVQTDKNAQKEGPGVEGLSVKGVAPVVQSSLMSNPLSDLALSEEMCKAAAAGHYGNRQLRVKKSPGRKVKDLHARYWSYLFDNLHRAVDEIYNTCETDESIVECQEVIMTLDNCRRDFVELIKRFELFERSDLQSSSSNLAWEVRKTTSPSKIRQQPLPYSRSHPRPPNLTKQHQQQSSLTSHLGQSKQKEATNTLTGTTATTTCSITTPVSHDRSNSGSTPSSTRVLDFGSSGRKRGRKVWPTDGNGASPSPSSNSNVNTISGSGLSQDQTTPTWADRVRGRVARGVGVAGCSTLGSLRPSPTCGNGGASKLQGAPPTNGVVHVLDTQRKRISSNSDGLHDSGATAEVDHILQTDCQPEKKEQDNIDSTQKPKREEEGEGDGDGWETVNNSRNQSRNNSATTVRPERSTQSASVISLGSSSSDGGRGSGDACKDNQPSSSSEASPCHEATCESSASPPSQVDLSTSQSDELSLVNADSDQGLSIEDLASGATQLLLDDGEEKGEKQGAELEDKSTELPHGTSTLSQGLSQASDKDSGWSDILAEYEAGAGYRGSVSWADRCESPPDDENIVLPEVPRSPGRAIHLHQRLSSPSRKRPVDDVDESRRLQEEKQAKAQLQRSLYLEEKAQKSKLESDKIRGARERNDALVRQRKEALEGKLQRAEKQRESYLQEIVRKAQEEEAKVSEISFINTLEAQNKKMEVLERYQNREARRKELQEERQRKKEEQQAKEEAAQERRRVMEAERQAKLMELQEKQREKDAKLEQKRQEKEKAREEAARERERKLEARNAALQSSAVELTKKIQSKQSESSRRYDQQLEQKKKAAADMTGSSRHASTEFAPSVEAYKKKRWCTICHIRIISEVYLMSHLRGQKHQEMLANLHPSPSSSSSETNPDVIVEASEEHQGPPSEQPEVLDRIKTGKKRAKKLRHRMASRSKEQEGGGTLQTQQQQVTTGTGSSGSSPATQTKHRAKLQKALRDFNKQIDSLSSSSHLGGAWDSAQFNQIDRSLGEMRRTLSSGGTSDQLCFSQLGGLASVLKMLLLCSEPAANCGGQERGRPHLPEKTFLLCVGVLQSACSGHVANSSHLLLSKKATALIDLSLQLLTEAVPPKEPPLQQQQQQGGGATVGGAYGSKATPICGPLLRLLASMISTLASGPLREDSSLLTPLLDVISYMVSVGLIDRLGDHFNTIVGPIGETELTQLVLGGLNLLVATTACMHTRVVNIFSKKLVDDPTLLTVVLKQTELVGLMQLLYAILLHDGPPRHSSHPPPLTNSTLSIATATIKTVNNCAIINLKMMQACLGAEGISLEFRHIVSYLLWYCSHFKNPALLHELILAIGYFCVLNHDNQVFLQSGRSPTLLQLLCGLPFEFFSNPEHTRLLFPTLISACYQVETNKQLLEQEISSKLLVTFLQENLAKETFADAKSQVKGQEVATSTNEQQSQKIVDYGVLFEHRFPKSHWKDAVSFFTK